MFTVRQSSDDRHHSHEGMSIQDAKEYEGMSIQDAKELALRVPRYPTMSVLYTQHSLQDGKLESGKEQGQSKLETVLLSKIQTYKGPIRKI
jgi:hypothetical protein